MPMKNSFEIGVVGPPDSPRAGQTLLNGNGVLTAFVEAPGVVLNEFPAQISCCVSSKSIGRSASVVPEPSVMQKLIGAGHGSFGPKFSSVPAYQSLTTRSSFLSIVMPPGKWLPRP